MQINTKSIKNHFEKSMDKYNANAVVQNNLAIKLSNKIAEIKRHYGTVFETGCGTGLLTKQLASQITFEKYYANDIVEKSKNYVSQIIPDVNFIHGNALKIKLPEKVDLMASNALFQWFSDFEKVEKMCDDNIKQDGILAFSTFGQENFKEIKELSGLSLNYQSKETLINILKKDFSILYEEEYTQTLEFNTPLELLSHMKNTGVNSLTTKRWEVKEVKDFCQNYLNKYDSVKLTYHPILIIAKH